MTFHVIIASHNRCESTLTSLRALYTAASHAQIPLDITLFDDGSTDDTASSVAAEFPEVTVLQGNGSAYWANSMARAETHVLEKLHETSADFILWLNDDVVLDPDALTRAAEVGRENSGAILVGAMRDPSSGQTTYSGFKRLGRHPLRLALVEPGSYAQRVDTFNGNFVLVPVSEAKRLGSIDGAYSHALADIDYGYRASANGIRTYLAPGTFGTCARNASQIEPSPRKKWAEFVGVKGGGHPSSLSKILKLGAPRLWPLYFVATYVIWWARAARETILLHRPRRRAADVQ